MLTVNDDTRLEKEWDYEKNEALGLFPDKLGLGSEKKAYPLIIQQMQSLAEISADPIAVMANVSALLFHGMEAVNWAGFYLVKDGALLLGPFQGKAACVKIEKGKGVCGTAWAEDRLQLVPDVHAFEGHIACDSASKSEIVVPLHRDGEVFAVLDIDSPLPARFTEADATGLTALAKAMEAIFR